MFKIYLVEGKSLIVLVKKLVSYMFLDEDLLVGETGINTEKSCRCDRHILVINILPKQIVFRQMLFENLVLQGYQLQEKC